MELEEAIKTLNEMKYLEIRPEYKVQAIERVLEELDKKDKVIELMANFLRHNIVTPEGFLWETNGGVKEYFYKKVEENE